jgi:hypothetical protein
MEAWTPRAWNLNPINNPRDAFYIKYSSLVRAELKLKLISKSKSWHEPVRLFLIAERQALFEEHMRSTDST